MSDPRYTDPRLAEPPPFDPDDPRRRRMAELEGSNAVWGWIAGGIVVALMLVFVFGRGPNSSDVARNDSGIPPASSSTPNAAPPPAMPPRPAPSTTGQNTPQ